METDKDLKKLLNEFVREITGKIYDIEDSLSDAVSTIDIYTKKLNELGVKITKHKG